MSEPPQDPRPVPTSESRPWLWILIGVAGLAIISGGAYWALATTSQDLQEELTSGDAERLKTALLAVDTDALSGQEARQTRDLTMEAMKQMPIEDMMGLWQDDSLTDEQRGQLMDNMRTIWMGHIVDIADDYMAASDEKKEEILDKQIDDFMEMRRRMQEYWEQHRDEIESQENREEQRERWRQRFRDTESRKQRMAQITPDAQAKMVYMMQQMQNRAKARGVEMGFGPGGRGRGPGGPGNREGRGANRDRNRDRDRRD